MLKLKDQKIAQQKPGPAQKMLVHGGSMLVNYPGAPGQNHLKSLSANPDIKIGFFKIYFVHRGKESDLVENLSPDQVGTAHIRLDRRRFHILVLKNILAEMKFDQSPGPVIDSIPGIIYPVGILE